jgi:hypothetical protein
MTETNDRAVEATTLGEIEVYRIRRAVRAALAAFDAAKETVAL